jgi:RNA-binding motif X-linked protein 2
VGAAAAAAAAAADTMNPLTQIKNTQKATMREIERGMGESASWHARFKHSAYIFAGGLPFTMTEGDVLAVFSQYGEIVDVNLVREEETGKSRGYAFVCYADQRSTVLAVDNLNGATVIGRTIKVDHVDDYKVKSEEDAGRREWRCACGSDNFKFRDACFKCGLPRPVVKKDVVERPVVDEANEMTRAAAAVSDVHDVVDEAGPRSAVLEDEDARIIRELQARKAAAIARAEAAVKGLPLDGEDDDDDRDRKRYKKEKKEKKDRRDRESRRDDSRERRRY